MGWTFTYKDASEKTADFLLREVFSWNSIPAEKRPHVVANSGNVFAVRYPAALLADDPTAFKEYEREADGSVVALTAVLTDRNKGEYNFGYKVIDETAGPYKKCPARLLKFVTPLKDNGSQSYKWAHDFRFPKVPVNWPPMPDIKDDDTIRLPSPVKIGGKEYDTFTALTMRYRMGRKIVKNGRVWITPTGTIVRLRRDTVRHAVVNPK